MDVTFILLSLSILSAWIPSFKLGNNYRIAPWLLLFSLAIISALIAKFITIPATIALVVFGFITWRASIEEAPKFQRVLFAILTGIFALAFAIHLVPGFNNPVVINAVQFSKDSAPFTQYANFDKASVGLLLLVFLCKRSQSLAEIQKTLLKTFPIAVGTIGVVILVAILLNYIKPDFKLPTSTLIFLTVNLLFTCVAEEAFFRGFLQEKLDRSLQSSRYRTFIIVGFSGFIFGISHIAGGTSFVLLATLAGFGYAYAYAVTKKIEAPILVHFALNAFHFICFTYPHLK